MNSGDVLTEDRKQTGTIYEPEAYIKSYCNDDGFLTEQIAVITDNTLRSLSNDPTSAGEALLNLGATKESIPTNLE